MQLTVRKKAFVVNGVMASYRKRWNFSLSSYIIFFVHSIDVLMCVICSLSLWLFQYVCFIIKWRNNKFYWNYFIDKLMFALSIQNAQTRWATTQTEWERIKKSQRHLSCCRCCRYMVWMLMLHHGTVLFLTNKHTLSMDMAYSWHLLWKKG